jgi:polycystin 1L2
LPNRINFSYVISNASPLDNPVIYSVVIVAMVFYIFFLAWAIWKDRQDQKRLEIIILEDNLFGDNYCYEVTVFTGNRKEAATDSKVSGEITFKIMYSTSR